MNNAFRTACLLVIAFAVACPAEQLPPIKPIARRIPPVGIDLPADVRAKLTDRLDALQTKLDAIPTDRADLVVNHEVVIVADVASLSPLAVPSWSLRRRWRCLGADRRDRPWI